MRNGVQPPFPPQFVYICVVFRCPSRAAAGLANSVVLTPVELVKVRAQAALAAGDARAGPLMHARAVVATAGSWRGLFRGLQATMARESVGVCCWLSGYEAAHSFLQSRHPSDPLSLPEMALSGSAGGGSFWLVAFPLDTVKSRLQSGQHPGGVMRCVADIVAQEGVTALYRGWLTAILRASLFVAPSIIVSYELVRVALH